MHTNEPFNDCSKLTHYSKMQKNGLLFLNAVPSSKLPIHTEGKTATKMLEYVKKTIFPKIMKIWEIYKFLNVLMW